MSKRQPRLLSLASTDGDTVLHEFPDLAARQGDGVERVDDGSASTAGVETDQVARDMAEIELAAAALRRAEPTLESWTNPPAHASPKPRPVWLLIAVLWFSTAVVTLGAVAAIAALVG
jgi:hypothetical protein